MESHCLNIVEIRGRSDDVAEGRRLLFSEKMPDGGIYRLGPTDTTEGWMCEPHVITESGLLESAGPMADYRAHFEELGRFTLLYPVDGRISTEDRTRLAK